MVGEHFVDFALDPLDRLQRGILVLNEGVHFKLPDLIANRRAMRHQLHFVVRHHILIVGVRFIIARSWTICGKDRKTGTGYNNGNERQTMAITLNDLTVNFRHLNPETLLEDWRWLIGPRKFPILLAAIGDAFVQDADDNSVHLVSVAAGEMVQVGADPEEFRRLLGQKEFVVDYLAVQVIGELIRAGMRLGPGQIYSYKQPPVLGGAFVLENIEPADIAVHFSLSGQIHEQVRGLPPGTPITGASIR